MNFEDINREFEKLANKGCPLDIINKVMEYIRINYWDILKESQNIKLSGRNNYKKHEQIIVDYLLNICNYNTNKDNCTIANNIMIFLKYMKYKNKSDRFQERNEFLKRQKRNILLKNNSYSSKRYKYVPILPRPVSPAIPSSVSSNISTLSNDNNILNGDSLPTSNCIPLYELYAKDNAKNNKISQPDRDLIEEKEMKQDQHSEYSFWIPLWKQKYLQLRKDDPIYSCSHKN